MSESKPLALVTGANGFIGQHLVQTLEHAGWDVRSVVRRSGGRNGEVVIGTIGPSTDWRAALSGVDHVVHLAARVHRKQEEHAVDLYRGVNLEGTLQLARCAATSGVRHFIFVSTVLVHGRSSDGRPPFRETDNLTPHGLYGLSKAAAEAGLKALASETTMKISVIRPPLVYGAGAKGNFALLNRAIRLGLPLPLASIRNQRAFVAVQNLNSFILWLLVHPDSAADFDTFLVADEEHVSTPEFIVRMARAAGKSPRLFGVPPRLLVKLLRLLGKRDIRESLLGSLELDLSKVMSTGWRPIVSMDEALHLALSAPTP